MIARADSVGGRDGKGRLSREDVEWRCLLHAIGDGCLATELPARLGLHPALAPALLRAVQPLVTRGSIEHRDERLHLTAAGREWRDCPIGERLVE